MFNSLFKRLAGLFMLMALLFPVASLALENHSRDPFQPGAFEHLNECSTLRYKTVYLHYLEVKPLLAIFQHKHLLSPCGDVELLLQKNALLLHDSPRRVMKLAHLLHRLDTKPLQVSIEARIVNINMDYLHALGAQFTTERAHDTTQLILDSTDISAPGILSLLVANLGHQRLLDVRLAALERSGRARVVASPHLLTLDRLPASIAAGDAIPYQQRAPGGVSSVAFREAALRLTVTPIIADHGNIRLTLEMNQDKLSPHEFQGVPAIATHHLSTHVLVESGHTVVLGGIYETLSATEVTGIPLLSKIPGLGKLFTLQHHQTKRSELLIFITPRIASP